MHRGVHDTVQSSGSCLLGAHKLHTAMTDRSATQVPLLAINFAHTKQVIERRRFEAMTQLRRKACTQLLARTCKLDYLLLVCCDTALPQTLHLHVFDNALH
jgi:hypothetical protein